MKKTEDFVKRIIILLIIAFIIPACDKSHHKDSDTSMRIKPGTLTAFGSPSTVSTVDGSSYNYAVIYNSAINNTNYVGIAVSNNPDATNYLTIYFQSPLIPTGSNIVLTALGNSLVIKRNGLDITASLTLNITKLAPINNYTRYLIEVTAGPLTTSGPEHITALYVGTNTQL